MPGVAAPVRRILVPIDPDRPAGAAFEQAAALAAALPAELVLLGIEALPLDEAPTAALVAADEATDDVTRQCVRTAEERLPAGVSSRTILRSAPDGPAIVDAARDEAADLVVVPMRRGGLLSHL